MNKVIKVMLLIAAFGFVGQKIITINKTAPAIYDEPYVAVYGRDQCGYTTRMLEDLNASGANYYYFKVDEQKVADFLHPRLDEVGIYGRYNLPVVDVNGSIFERPKFSKVEGLYNASL